MTTLTARCPEDVLAAVPVVLGFVPADSVVMLTFGAECTFHARVDLPTSPDDVDEMVEALLDPARHNGVRRVVFVAYSDDAAAARRCGRALERAFAADRIDVVEMLRADGSRWFPLLGRRPGVPEWGVPYDVSAHPFLAMSVLEGQVTHASRDELAATLDRTPSAVTAVADLVAGLGPWGRTEAPAPTEVLAEGEWVQALVERRTADGSTATDDEVARLLRGMQVLRVRDAAWSTLERRTASAHVRFWTDVVRRTPDPLLAPPATLLGWAAWQAGHGALAWCGIDLAAAADPDYTLMTHLAQLLVAAVPPQAWEPGVDWAEGLGRTG